MSDLGKEKRTLSDLPGLVKVHTIKVGAHKRKPRTKEHNEAISDAKKKYYASEEGIEERVFIGENIPKDTAAPIISSHELTENTDGSITVKARIHDNKSPNMPQDWKSVDLLFSETDKSISMEWYGENLWVATFASPSKTTEINIVAIDYCGNKTSIMIE